MRAEIVERANARRRLRIPSLALGAASAWLAFGGGLSAAFVAVTALGGLFAAGRATRYAAGCGYALGLAFAAAAGAALVVGPRGDVGFVVFALALLLVGAWMTLGAERADPSLPRERVAPAAARAGRAASPRARRFPARPAAGRDRSA